MPDGHRILLRAGAILDNRAVMLMTIALAFALVGAWLTHAYVSFNAGAWGSLVFGSLLFPFAIVHGIGLWFGLW